MSQLRMSELYANGKADINIRESYDKTREQRSEARERYVNSRNTLRTARDRENNAWENYQNTTGFGSISAYFRYRRARRTRIESQNIRNQNRTEYIERLRELRRFNREIRGVYRNYRAYTDFFRNVEEANRRGLTIPDHIIDEYNRQRAGYSHSKYTLDENGDKTLIYNPGIRYAGEVSDIIARDRRGQIRSNVIGAVNNIRNGIDRALGRDDDRDAI